MSPATLPLHSTAGSVDNGSALYIVRTRHGIRAPASRATKAARPSAPPKAVRYLQDFAPECDGPFSRTGLQFAQRGAFAATLRCNHQIICHFCTSAVLSLPKSTCSFSPSSIMAADRRINNLAVVEVNLDAVAYRVSDTGWGLRLLFAGASADFIVLMNPTAINLYRCQRGKSDMSDRTPQGRHPNTIAAPAKANEARKIRQS
jgi:hypothetical protein